MQVFPPTSELKPQLMTLLQIRLMKKLGDNAYPFIFVVSIPLPVVTITIVTNNMVTKYLYKFISSVIPSEFLVIHKD